MCFLIKPESGSATGSGAQDALCGGWVVVVEINRDSICVWCIRIMGIGRRGNLNREQGLELNAVNHRLNRKRGIWNAWLYGEQSERIDKVNGRILHVEVEIRPLAHRTNILLVFGKKASDVRIVVSCPVEVEIGLRVELAARVLERIDQRAGRSSLLPE